MHPQLGVNVLCSLKCRQLRKRLKEQFYQLFDEGIKQGWGRDKWSGVPW